MANPQVHESFSNGKLVSSYKTDAGGKVTESTNPKAKVGAANPYVDPGDPKLTPGKIPFSASNPDPTATAPGAIQPPTSAPNNAVVNAPNTQPTVPGANDSKIVGAQYYDQKTGALNQAGQQYKTALNATQASGAAVPPTMGQAATTMGQAIQNPQTDPSPLTPIVDTDTTFDNIFTQYDDFFSPMKQKQSLLQEYKSMEKKLGINAMNEELLNSKKIIEGTEDDIRSEVQAVNGFATDSQVLSLANARNKSLVKNYNYLLEARDSAMTQLSTMMNLSVQDRQLASQEFDRKMNFGFKVMEFKQKAIDNAREGYNNTIKLMGADGMYQALQSDPSAISLVEKTLGVPAGGLAIAAQQATKARVNQETMDVLDIKGKKLSNENLRSEIDARNNAGNEYGTLTGKPQNATQTAANGYADRLNQSEIIINNLGGKFTDKNAFGGSLPSIFQSGDRQSYEQAKKDFVTAILRRQSGASIAPSEFKTEQEKYFPQAGDKPEIIKQKADSRNTAINGLYREANVPRPLLPGMIIEKGGKKYKVTGGDMSDPDIEPI